MVIQKRYFELLCLYVFVLLLIPYNKLVSKANSVVVGDGTTKSWCMENEREALLEFKQGLVDDYGVLSSWGREEGKRDCCKWRGVKCSNRTGHVITLDLRNQVALESGEFNQPLRGKISPSLLQLKQLTHLDLSSTDFQVSHFPKFIGSLNRLRYLNLQHCNFFGTIPHELGNLTNLRSLYLGGYAAALTVDNLEWLSDLRFLRKLNLFAMDLKKIDWLQSIDKLPFLSELHLVSCNLPGIISPSFHSKNHSSTPLKTIDMFDNYLISSLVYNWLFNFSSSLVEIEMSYNPLGGSIPDDFGSMMSLESLTLFSCDLEGEIPKSLKNLSYLRSLSLGYNNLTGQLPALFETLSASENSLEILDLSWNKFYGSLPDFTRFSSLRDLWLGSNKLQGSFPASFSQSSLLDTLVLAENEMNGSFPDLTSFPLLRVLLLSNNKLKGRVPESIGQLSNLKQLSLSFNLLSLQFTSNWTPLFQLDSIQLAHCELGTCFQEWLRSQNIFYVLDISSAGISDSVPYWFWDLSPRLLYLNISNNQIRGMIPDLSLRFVKLKTIDVHANHFEGPIPLLPRNVSLLNLSKNMFSGSIISVCTFASELLRSFDLSDNLLSGDVPDCWIHANNLEILDLANNNFSGKIPTSFGFLNLLQLLSLRNNHFTGALPSSLKTCTALEVIDMSENKLSGQVPAWVGTHLTSLVVLSFRRNEFRGSIPHSLCNLYSTQVLDLSQNKLSGNIPKCFNKLYSLIQTRSSSATVSFGFSDQQGSYYDNHWYTYYTGDYVANALVQWKGKVSEYRNTLRLLKCVDLSSNKLVGHIPQELANLEGLISLNLSRNNLTGDIIQNVSRMKMLEVLDLSRNHLSGTIPIGLVSLNFLSVLDLSNNNLSGRIPSSTQLQSFNASVYAGNRELCGLPLPNKCPGEDESASIPPPTDLSKDETDEEDENMFVTGLYVSVVLGFAVGFWGFVGPVLLLSSWRNACFKFLDKLQDWICVTIPVNNARLQRKFRG